MKEESASEEVSHDERKFTWTNMLLNNLLQTPLHIAAQQLDREMLCRRVQIRYRWWDDEVSLITAASLASRCYIQQQVISTGGCKIYTPQEIEPNFLIGTNNGNDYVGVIWAFVGFF